MKNIFSILINDLTYITTMVIDFPKNGEIRTYEKSVKNDGCVCLYEMIYYLENTEKIRKHSGDSVYKMFTFRKYFFEIYEEALDFTGADDQNRTGDLLITNYVF